MGSGSSKTTINADMHVAIIGGGYGGFLLAHQLLSSKVCKVTMIDPKDCMVHSVGALRASVEQGT